MKLLAVFVVGALAGCGAGSSANDAAALAGADGAAGGVDLGRPAADGAAGARGDARLVVDGSVRDVAAERASDAGAKVCHQAAEVSRSCERDTDCIAVTLRTSCCDNVWFGIRASTNTEFETLEAACERSYPACSCAVYGPTTDDGSIVPDRAAVGVSCQAGTCRTFSNACGQPCERGRSCATCAAQGSGTCALHCIRAADCTDPKATRCQVVGPTHLCVDPAVRCSRPDAGP